VRRTYWVRKRPQKRRSVDCVARSLAWYLPAASSGAMAPRMDSKVMVMKAILKVSKTRDRGEDVFPEEEWCCVQRGCSGAKDGV